MGSVGEPGEDGVADRELAGEQGAAAGIAVVEGLRGGRAVPVPRSKVVQACQRSDLLERRPRSCRRGATTSHSDVRRAGWIVALRDATEAPLAEASPHPGRHWNPSEIASIRTVDTAWAKTLRVRYGDSADPRFPPLEAVRRACRGAVWHP